ncbi:disease resistance protein [Tanacetum coccineum]
MEASKSIIPILSALKNTLKQIQGVLYDADMKQTTQKGVEEWLKTLTSDSLEVENVLDEAFTKAMIQNLHSIKHKLTPSTVSVDATGVGGEILNSETSSLKSKIYRRDEEKKMIVDKICNQDIGIPHDDDDDDDDDDVRHNVAVLSKEDSWSLFKMLAFPDRQEGENIRELELVGREIVEKCKGLPLAVKTLGSLMLTKEKVNEWRLVNDKFMSEMQDNGILTALRLSYDNLLPHLR